MTVRGLETHNVSIDGQRTSLRLEPSMWDALRDVAGRERITVDALCTLIKRRLDAQRQRTGLTPKEDKVTFTSAVRVMLAAYYRRAATEEGHAAAGHGGEDPFRGTPFEGAA